MSDEPDDQPPKTREHLHQCGDLERAYLEGEYEALSWVLTSPAIPKSVIERIESRALSLVPRLKELGARFDG
jgi:hypothetical protein